MKSLYGSQTKNDREDDQDNGWIYRVREDLKLLGKERENNWGRTRRGGEV
jgi:hypothetical protein